MAICLNKFKHVVAALLVVLGFGVAPAAGQGLDEATLLDLLRTSPPPQAEAIESELVDLWSRSGSRAMDFLLRRGRRAIEAGDVNTAIDHLTALTDHAPDFAEGWNARAIAYYQAGLYGPSISDIQRALALNPNHFGAMAGLALMLEDMGEYDNALKVQRQIRAIHPTRATVTEAINRLTLLAGQAEI